MLFHLVAVLGFNLGMSNQRRAHWIEQLIKNQYSSAAVCYVRRIEAT